MDSFDHLDVPGRANNVRGLGLLRIFTIFSAIIGQLTFVFSTIYFLALHQDYANQEIDEACANFSKNIEFCEFLTNWSLCSVFGIVVGSLQIIISIASASFKTVETKTNVWCATHACFVVILAPVLILTLASHRRVGSFSNFTEDDLASISKKQLLFVTMVAVNSLFSLVSIIIIPLTYGLEVQLKYTRLINLE